MNYGAETGNITKKNEQSNLEEQKDLMKKILGIAGKNKKQQNESRNKQSTRYF